MTSLQAVEFDSGPLHGAALLVDLNEQGELPGVVWTDEGDYLSTYVLSTSALGAHIYDYTGETWDSERQSCPRVDANRRAPDPDR